jgi:hypothetical protein
MAGLIIPKIYIENPGTLIFLAGPIRGAPNWQDKAAKMLLSKDPRLTIFSPRRGVRPEIEPFILKGDENYFERQRICERYYLKIAKVRLFWLPGEIEHNCSKSYGAMTRLEFGQVMTNYKYNPSAEFCVGSDGNFSELGTIKVDLKIDAPNKKVIETLEETCEEALRLAK